MHVISMTRLRAFWQRHPRAEPSLRRWYGQARKATWRNLPDVRLTFPHADPVTVASGTILIVFNAGGNNYRVVARVEYDYGRVYVKDVLTHADYSKDRWKEQL